MTTNQIDIFAGTEAAEVLVPDEQFRLTRFQLMNWGTINDLVDLAIAPEGYLIAGPSGTGKSTLLDANATLLTPPRNLTFNTAAKDSSSLSGSSRTLMSYVRGAYANRSNKHGEVGSVYLRDDTVLSGLAQSYESNNGRHITLGLLCWVRGASVDPKDLKKYYFISDRPFALLDLKAFTDSNYDVKELRKVEGLTLYAEFSGYRERFTRVMGIENESALRLLHKTQFTKDVGDMSSFLRTFTLEEPQTMELVDQMVSHFHSLREAHTSVLNSRRQIELLAPAKESYVSLLAVRKTMEALQSTRLALDAIRERTKATLLLELIQASREEIKDKQATAADLRVKEAYVRSNINVVQGKLQGGGMVQIAKCEDALRAAKNHLRTVEDNLSLLDRMAELVTEATPSNSDGFYELQATVRKHVAAEAAKAAKVQTERDGLKLRESQKLDELSKLQSEMAAMGRTRSNIPSKLLDMRRSICDSLGISTRELPFAGEMLDVADAHREWKPAAERVMREFAEHMIVADENFVAMRELVNRSHMGGLVKYYHAKPGTDVIRNKPDAESLYSKMEFSDHSLSPWLKARVAYMFDHICVDSTDQFSHVTKGLTRQGMVKGSNDSYRKDDRSSINDRSQWRLGGDTSAKMNSYLEQAHLLDADLQAIRDSIVALESDKMSHGEAMLCERFIEAEWETFDFNKAQRDENHAMLQLDLAKDAVPDVDDLQDQLVAMESEHAGYQKLASTLEAQSEALAQNVAIYESRSSNLNPSLLAIAVPPEVEDEVRARYEALNVVLALDNIDQHTATIKDAISKEERTTQQNLASYQNAMLNGLKDYAREWPSKAADLEISEGGASEFFEILDRLQADGLASHEARFMQLMREQAMHELMRLSAQIKAEQKSVRSRMGFVNDSLKNAAYNPGSHLTIGIKDKQLPDVMDFLKLLREAANGAATDDSVQGVEARFKLINDLVKRLESSDPVDRRWRDLCLDVRQHLSFVVSEVSDETGEELEVFLTSDSLSGGQRQKLTATILAASLRYQLSGKTFGLPMFSTVFLDEAFDKSDTSFAEAGILMFKQFGFQLIGATPLRNVAAFEPHVGGCAFVSINQRKVTKLTQIKYRSESKSLDFGSAGISILEYDQN